TVFYGRTYLLILVSVILSGFPAKACSLNHYAYCKIALGKKFEFESKVFKNDGQSEIPKLRRKYKTKGIQVIFPTIPFLTIREFSYSSDFVPHLTRSNNIHIQIRANCKRGPPLS